MYRPDAFKIDDHKTLRDFIAKYPLGTIATLQNGEVAMDSLPFLFEERNEKWVLTTHAAATNPLSKLPEGSSILVNFQGPDRYISPTWYKSANQVPTWNYLAVQVRGTLTVTEAPDKIDEVLSRSVKFFERRNQTTWQYDTPEKVRAALLKHIRGLEIAVEAIEGKFKISQNRGSVDFASVMEHLGQSSHNSDLDMLAFMRTSHKI